MYTETLKQEAKELYPDNKELHYYLKYDDPLAGMFLEDDIKYINSPDEIQLRKWNLYMEWLTQAYRNF